MTFVLSALAFLLLLTLLVIVHELGHFSLARFFGVEVEEFGFGLPPRAKHLFFWRGTLFSLNWIPFGGFVRLQGETSMDPLDRVREGSFAAASIPARLMILAAGVFMNLVLALLLLTIGFWLWRWVPTYIDVEQVRLGALRGEVAVDWGLYVTEVIPGGNADKVGMRAEGILQAVNGTEVERVDQVLALQEGESAVRYTVLYPSSEERETEEYTEESVFDVQVLAGKTGIALSEFAQKLSGNERSFLQGARLAARETWTVVSQTVVGAGKLFATLLREGRVPKGITGIIGIAQLTHASVQEGLMTYLRLVALLSLSLAALNILPFPALDGGRMVFVFVEMLTGRPMYRRVEVISNALGFVFLLFLILAITVNDVVRIFSP